MAMEPVQPGRAVQPLKARKYNRDESDRVDASSVQGPLCGDKCLPSRFKYLPSDNRCLVARELKDAICLTCDDLQSFKRAAEMDALPPKQFLKELYRSKNYVRQYGKKKRGNKAINWRKEEGGEFLCPSLHDANNIYEALGKKKWAYSKVKTKNTPAVDEIRCIFIVNTGLKCSRKMCENSTYCTLHHKKINMNR